jgi:hypothetical protein
MVRGVRAPEQSAPPRAPTQPERFAQAVERYAGAWTDAARMREQALPLLVYQKAALREAGAALEEVRAGARRDLMRALHHEPAVERALRHTQGRERARALVAGIEREARMRVDPELNAARLVRVWKTLEARHANLHGWEQAAVREWVEVRMKFVAQEIKRSEVGSAAT